jgi:hypothetical protein
LRLKPNGLKKKKRVRGRGRGRNKKKKKRKGWLQTEDKQRLKKFRWSSTL